MHTTLGEASQDGELRRFGQDVRKTPTDGLDKLKRIFIFSGFSAVVQ